MKRREEKFKDEQTSLPDREMPKARAFLSLKYVPTMATDGV